MSEKVVQFAHKRDSLVEELVLAKKRFAEKKLDKGTKSAKLFLEICSRKNDEGKLLYTNDKQRESVLWLEQDMQTELDIADLRSKIFVLHEKLNTLDYLIQDLLTNLQAGE